MAPAGQVHAPGLSAGSGGNFSTERDVLNGERIGSARPGHPLVPAGSPTPPVCGQFVAAEGAAWPWCDTCGWRLDFHEPDHPIARRWAEHWKGSAL